MTLLFIFIFYYCFSILQAILCTHLKIDNAQLRFSLLISLRISGDAIPKQKEKKKKTNISPLCEQACS